MNNEIKYGFISFINAWKNINYKKAITWGFLSSIYTGVLLLSIGYLSDKIKDPLIGYVLKSILSNVILVPIFLIAYLMIDKKNASFFKDNIGKMYIWLSPCIILSSLSGILMIFMGDIYIFYGIFVLNVLYLIFTMYTPFYFLEHKDVKDSITGSIKKIFEKPNILIAIVLNIIFVIIIFQGVGYLSYIIAGYNINIGLILSIIISLSKPLLYSLPLFNILVIASSIKNSNNKKIEKNKVGDII